jgi:trehalose 6-phosphate synthase/phosphatase
MQHLWTGPISNAPVEIIQGGRSVEVRPVGVTKGLAMQRILGYMAHIMGRQVRAWMQISAACWLRTSQLYAHIIMQ